MGRTAGMIPVRDFTDAYDNNHKLDTKTDCFDWDKILTEEGYHVVSVPGHNWADMHRWCQDNVDPRNYVWVGFNFYFTRHNDAVLFALKWA